MSLWVGALLLLTFTSCVSSPAKPSSIQDIIRNKLTTLKALRDRTFGKRIDSTALSFKGRDYGGGVGGYSNNYDTALTALAFLSFGVYLLNLLLMAMNRTTGRKRRDTEYEYRSGDVTSLSELMSVIGDSFSSYFYKSPTPECGFKSLCIAKESLRRHRSLRSVISSPEGRQVAKLLSSGSYHHPVLGNVLERENCSRYKVQNCHLVDKLDDVFLELTEPRKNVNERGASHRIRRENESFGGWGVLQSAFEIIRHLFTI